mmetsp:Transcript_68033/g.171540  ORF Transcript_68033/g.171540 Transcript_68033/m.171540 type:complete len:163 (+) Transcript_68033:36-524(+)
MGSCPPFSLKAAGNHRRAEPCSPTQSLEEVALKIMRAAATTSKRNIEIGKKTMENSMPSDATNTDTVTANTNDSTFKPLAGSSDAKASAESGIKVDQSSMKTVAEPTCLTPTMKYRHMAGITANIAIHFSELKRPFWKLPLLDNTIPAALKNMTVNRVKTMG